MIRRTAYLVDGDKISAEALRRFGSEWSQGRPPLEASPPALLPLRDATAQFQRGYCRHLLELTDGDVGAAADLAGYGRRGLRELLVRLELA
ncbi:MAG: hypothetical protein ACRBN8_24155 [Nannocystales bacterium]